MARMIRKQVYIEPRQDRVLKERARRYRVTEAELIRQAIDQALTAGAVGGGDPAAWTDLKRLIARLRKRQGPGRILRWTRNELYDR